MINKTSFEFKIVIWFFFKIGNIVISHASVEQISISAAVCLLTYISKHLIRKLLKKVKRLYSTSLSEYQTVFFILFQYNNIGKLKMIWQLLTLVFPTFLCKYDVFNKHLYIYTIAFKYPSNTCKCWFIVLSINSKYHFFRFPVTCIHFYDT